MFSYQLQGEPVSLEARAASQPWWSLLVNNNAESRVSPNTVDLEVNVEEEASMIKCGNGSGGGKSVGCRGGSRSLNSS